MEREQQLSAVISGSFKFKPEIDKAHEELADHNVLVLAPDTGWIYVPRMIVAPENGIRPLPSERYLPLEEIENEFLRRLAESDFVYLMNIDGYLGTMTAFELGYAQAIGKPIYAAEPLGEELLGEYCVDDRNFIASNVHVMPLENVATHFRHQATY